MNKIFLKLTMLPAGLWRSLGADTAQLNAILSVRLTLDDRRPNSLGRMRAAKKERKNGTLLNMFISAVMGFIYTLPLVSVNDRIFSLTIYFSLFLLLLSLTLITDFSTVLFDTRDKYIILPRPVTDKTIVLARLLHVFIYLLRLVLPMSLPGWIVLGMADGWKSAVLFPFILLLTVFIALFFVNACYLAILKVSRPEKFKEVINYFQIVTSVVFFAIVYLLPRAFDADKALHLNIHDYSWLRYMPSYWLAACWSWIGFPAALSGTVWIGALAVLFPLGCVYVLVRWLAPQFSRAIAGMDVADATEYKTPQAGIKKVRSGRLYHKLANVLSKDDAERSGFIITWLQTSRSRTFKMRVYPTFAYVPVYFIYLVTLHNGSLNEIMHGMKDKPVFLYLLYMCSFVILQALNYLTISDQYKAAWVYYATPVETPGRIMAGAFKAMWVKYFFPFFAILSVFVLSVWGLPSLIDIFLALVNVTLFAVCMVRVSYRQLPFSIMEQMNQRGNRILKAFIGMIIPGTLGFAHYFSLYFFWLKIIFLILSCLLLWLVWDSYKNTSWANMNKSEME